jgi:hypothetical protein
MSKSILLFISMDMDMEYEHRTRTWKTDMEHGHGTQTWNTDMEHGHGTRTWTQTWIQTYDLVGSINEKIKGVKLCYTVSLNAEDGR